jgi:phosphopantothenoylcysteine decarboxylase/phosphopantothenate--cysteine ligase
MRVLLIITGSVAAYKACEVLRLLQKQGHSVQVIMTSGAQQFISPLTLSALSGHPVYTDLFSLTDEATMGHIRLAREADVVLVAPASADFLATMAMGAADDLARAVLLATTAPVWVAPAMNPAMYAHAATQANIETLKKRGISVIEPAVGEAACGEEGQGRMAEPETIVGALLAPLTLTGKSVLLTVGATREPLDPVRFLSNASSGQMGYALAAAAAERGAEVVILEGFTTAPRPTSPRIHYIKTPTAEAMRSAALAQIQNRPQPFDYCLAVAAVADYRCEDVCSGKRPKTNPLTLTLVPTVDVLATLAALPAGQRPRCVIGFAAQTEDTLAKAAAKRIQKNCDIILANTHTPDAPAFDSPDNALTLITEHHEIPFPRQSKESLASMVWDQVTGDR